MTHKIRLSITFLIIFLSGCSSLAPLLSSPTPAPTADSTATPKPNPTSTSPSRTLPTTLRVWLPPRFDPAGETEAGQLLEQQLQSFEADHPRIKIEVRIKGGSTNIVDFLSTTNSAAPESMPDLIALSYNDLQTAASAGFLHPLDGLTSLMQDPDWYAFARELGTVKNAGYAIPFAADAMTIVYRTSVFETLPSDWGAVFDSGVQLVFPASDSQHFFPLSLYLSANGLLVDEEGAFTLDEAVFTRVLSIFQDAYEEGAIPMNIRDFDSDLASLTSFRNGETDMVVVWASSDIGINSGSYAPILGLDDIVYSVGDGWVWALAGSNAENQPLAIELASYLVESEYMSDWTSAAGYLPTRPLALDGWNEGTKKGLDEVLLAAHPAPSPEVVAAFGPIMQGALIRIFNGEQAEVVARSVVESLK